MDLQRHEMMTISPGGAAKRRAAHWRGLSAEIVQYTATEPFEYGFCAPVHLFTAVQRAVRLEGETRVEGALSSTRRDFGRTMCFIPAGYRFKGSFVPKVLPRSAYFYIDPANLAVGDELGLAGIAFEPRLFFDEPALWATSQKILRLVAEGGDNRLYAETLIVMLAIELIRFHKKGGLRQPVARGGLAEWQRRAVIEFINDTLDRNISLEDLANLVRLSPNHFCQAFAQSMGMPPHQYQRRQRVERAKLLLADADRSITEVAMAVGYSAPSNFATAFRRVTGLTPRDFRRRLL